MPDSKVLRVYLDIDGTILYYPPDGEVSETLDFQRVCDGLEPFLRFVRRHCQPYWLSMRCRLGRMQALEERLFPHLPEVAATIPAAYWENSKCEALNTQFPFLWFDDDPEPGDVRWLARHRVGSSLIRVDHMQADKPAHMLRVVQKKLETLSAPGSPRDGSR